VVLTELKAISAFIRLWGCSGIGSTSVDLNPPSFCNNTFTVEKQTTVLSNVVQIIKEN
jgi:hypothetical protein